MIKITLGEQHGILNIHSLIPLFSVQGFDLVVQIKGGVIYIGTRIHRVRFLVARLQVIAQQESITLPLNLFFRIRSLFFIGIMT